MEFSTFTTLCNHHQYIIPEHGHQPKGSPYSFKSHSSFLSPQPLATTHLFSVSMDLPILDISHKNPIIGGFFCAWLLSLSLMISRFILVTVLNSFLWLNNIPLYGYTTFGLSIHQFICIWVVFSFGHCEYCCCEQKH